jgi:heme A synthase
MTKVLALKATVLLLLTLLIKAKVQIVAGSALGIALLLLQALVFLVVSGGLVLAAGGATLYATTPACSGLRPIPANHEP